MARPIQGFHERRNQENLWIVISIRFLAYASDSEFRQKGAIENVNGLIRQYIPKNTCFSNISQQQITKIMQIINTRPRENSISQLLMSAFTKKCCKFALAS